jgi:lysyl endopeptidase
MVYNTELEGGTWSLLSGSVVTWWSNIGAHLSFYPAGASGELIKFRLTKNNSCGNQYYDFYFTPTLYNNSSYSIYTVSPNPASSMVRITVDEAKLSQEKIAKSNSQDIKEITIVDKMGVVISRQIFGKNIRMANLNVSNLKPDIYILKIFNGKDYTSLKFIKE